MNWYFKLVASHPCTIVLTIGTFSAVALIISITTSKLPNFSDPQLGFETRGTEIAKRLTTWENLYEATRPSGILTVNPNSESERNISGSRITIDETTGSYHHNKKIISNISFIKSERSQLNNYHESLFENNFENVDKEGESDFINDDNDDDNGDNSSNHENHDHDHLSSDGFFCEGLSPDYAHIVLETTKPSQSLLSVDALFSICAIQQKLMDNKIVNSICQTVSNDRCCKPWSLPNYITLLHNLTDCMSINEENVEQIKALLYDCSKYYNNLKLISDCHDSSLCHGVPHRCKRFNAVYNMLYYLTDIDFLPINYTLDRSRIFLNRTMIFLPIARSSAALPYYYNLSSSTLRHRNVQVSAMDLGLKNALFNDCLVRDASLMVAGGVFMIFCIWSYTNSLLITISTLMAIVMSLIISYFIYMFIFKIKFFPFMNLLALIVAVGIGADDVFIFYKTWRSFDSKKFNSSVVQLVSDTLKHSSLSMLMTSLTTAAAFYSSSVSSITAINCFSVFAGTAVLANFLLMITWLPACFVIHEKISCPPTFCKWKEVMYTRIISVKYRTFQHIKISVDKYLVLTVIRLRWIWLLIFSTIAVGCAVVVLYYPKLRLPDSRNFHLFQSGHLFERYDVAYKDKFWFERLENINGWDNNNFKLPLRFVWGLHAIDNGNYFEPNSKGTLLFDSAFDVAAPESQSWLLGFCRLLRKQPFYQSTSGPLLPNCFIESFKNWMQRRCRDAIDNIDRTPCCESSKFPYSREVFNNCIVKAMGSLYETPADYFLPGVAGPKFSKLKREHIKVVVVEYDSNHSYSMSFNDMHNFYTEVENWFQTQLAGAPPGMRNGWFISQLGFYDLQLALSNGTSVAIGVSMVTALAVFFLINLNIVISIYTITTISFIIFVTVGLLVLLGWSLNVVESIAVTTAIGLAVDFSIHYGINYGLFIENSRESAVGLTLTRMGGPTLMAALTTGAAGFFMLPSSVLAYIQIGVFLLIVMASSWLYSTMFLMSLLSTFGPQKGFGQFSYKSMFSFCHWKDIGSPVQSNKTVFLNIPSDSIFSSSSITEGNLPNFICNEIHEMEAVNEINNFSEP